ncbi:MAG TPA: hypothetical protein VJL87_02970 [Bdellovibrionota bacterium]|nr:hypothetical protein [Bdellovibrionota bacterium]
MTITAQERARKYFIESQCRKHSVASFLPVIEVEKEVALLAEQIRQAEEEAFKHGRTVDSGTTLTSSTMVSDAEHLFMTVEGVESERREFEDGFKAGVKMEREKIIKLINGFICKPECEADHNQNYICEDILEDLMKIG